MNTRHATSFAFRKRRERTGAFTLLEVLVAMAIAAIVIVGMSTMLFSMGELWGRNMDRHLFELHARNVTRFLQNELYDASRPPTGGSAGAASTSGSTTSATSPLTIEDIRDQTGNTNSLITYELPNGSRLCTWPERALPNVVCSLIWRQDDGLVLLWHSRLEMNFDTDAPRETVITPYVTAMTYDYYDTDLKTWKNETVLRKDNSNQGVLPQRVHLVFTYSGRTIETILDIPGAPTQGLPML